MSPKTSTVPVPRFALTPVTRSRRGLLSDVRQLILQARAGVARAVDSGLVALYWHVGRRIRQDILKEKRAEYGKRILQSLSAKLVQEFGRGYSQRNLASMVRFAEVFPDPDILQSLIAKLGWTHFQSIIYLGDPLQRDFYAEMCRIENWNTRTLKNKIGSMLFERTALSKKPDKLSVDAGARIQLWRWPSSSAGMNRVRVAFPPRTSGGCASFSRPGVASQNSQHC